MAAAVLGGHADNGSRAASPAPPHYSDNTHSDPHDDSPDSPCGDTLIPVAPIAGEYKGPVPDHSSLEWLPVDAPVATSSTAVSHSANFALARAAPPHSLRLYLRTQRLLI